MPEIKFAEGVESLFLNPAKAPSSRNGESWSSNSETRSRAAQTEQQTLDAFHTTVWQVSPLTQKLTPRLMSPQRDIISLRRDLLQSMLELLQHRRPTLFVRLEQLPPQVQVRTDHWKRRLCRHRQKVAISEGPQNLSTRQSPG